MSMFGKTHAACLALVLFIGLGCRERLNEGYGDGDAGGAGAAEGVSGNGGAVAGGSGGNEPAGAGSAAEAGGAGEATGGNGAAGTGGADAGEPSGVTDGSVDVDASAGPDAGPVDSGPGGTGPGDWGPGDYPPDIAAQSYLEITGVTGQKGYTRQYKVHVPPGYDPQVPAPLVFCIHGLMQDAVMFCVTGAAMHTKSDQEGFLLVMPNGYQNSWNAGTCCGGASAEQLDDVALFRAILQEVGGHLNVDLDRVYATGLSNGGFMSYRLACQATDMLAAVAPGAGAIGTNQGGWGTNPASDFTVCEPSRPISVLDIHGTADGLVPYSLQQPSVERLAGSNGCMLDTEPAADPASGGDTTCVSYRDCPAGVETIACSVTGGGHCWFGSPDCGTGGGPIGLAVVGANSNTLDNNSAIWDFFRRHSR